MVEGDPVGPAVDPLHEDTPVEMEPHHEPHQTDDGQTEDEADVVGPAQSVDAVGDGDLGLGGGLLLIGTSLHTDQASGVSLVLLLLEGSQGLGDDGHVGLS